MAAVLSRDGAHPADARRMLAVVSHRGGTPAVVRLGDAVIGALGGCSTHESLAVHDGLALVFVGVLDNAAVIERCLAGDRRGRRQGTPAELVLAGWRRMGSALIERLRGTYAAVVTDGRTLWCFRDHLGFAPLFYRHARGACFVASEAKQVVAGAGLPYVADREVCERIFFHELDDDLPAALRGVSRLPKATLLTATGKGTATQRYWHPDRLLESARLDAAEVQDRFDELMGQASARALNGADVVSLSGGVDSPVVAAYAAPAHRQRFGAPLAALSTFYPDHLTVDERPYVEDVAHELGLRLHFHKHQPATLENQGRWAKMFDGPVPTVMVEEISAFYGVARDLGYRNMLTGELAEFVCDLPDGLMYHLVARGRLAAVRSIARNRGLSPLRLARQVAGAFAPSAVAAWKLRRLVTERGIPDWLDADRVRRNYTRRIAAPRHRWRQLQLSGFAGPGLSMEADEICQALAGVRCRRPFADVDLWEFFLSLPAEQKHPPSGRKALLRRLARGTAPDVILDRQDKTVFNEVALATVDYPGLRTWLSDPLERLPGVDYDRLAVRLERQDLSLLDYVWAKDLSSVHAFLRICQDVR